MLNKITEQKPEMLSLYDYLGRAAGNKLGEQVAAYAKFKKTRLAIERETKKPDRLWSGFL